LTGEQFGTVFIDIEPFNFGLGGNGSVEKREGNDEKKTD
jgi:hypothetical protein